MKLWVGPYKALRKVEQLGFRVQEGAWASLSLGFRVQGGQV